MFEMTQDHISRLIISDKVLATSQIKNGGTNRGEGGNVEINQEAAGNILLPFQTSSTKFVELFQKFSFDVYDSKFSFFFLFQRRKIGKRNDLLFNFIFIMNSSLTFRILSSNAK